MTVAVVDTGTAAACIGDAVIGDCAEDFVLDGVTNGFVVAVACADSVLRLPVARAVGSVRFPDKDVAVARADATDTNVGTVAEDDAAVARTDASDASVGKVARDEAAVARTDAGDTSVGTMAGSTSSCLMSISTIDTHSSLPVI